MKNPLTKTVLPHEEKPGLKWVLLHEEQTLPPYRSLYVWKPVAIPAGWIWRMYSRLRKPIYNRDAVIVKLTVVLQTVRSRWDERRKKFEKRRIGTRRLIGETDNDMRRLIPTREELQANSTESTE